ncbi:hypothetical protein HD554DRAFT_2043438 [Boletus coccyginus]|nr:hypothetical protein HD554DRAFT_2043438 [Boletus coccyginus]
MSSTSEQTYQRKLAEKAVTGLPSGGVVYAVFTEFATLRQQRHRFIIYPQMSLKWNPEDQQGRRSEVGLGNFTLPGSHPNFKLRCGVEAKDLRNHFHTLSFQAEDQAKAAYKNKYPLSDSGVQWILLAGPYWTPKTFGPFSEAKSSVRALKISGSGDFEVTTEFVDRMQRTPSELDELYLPGTQESFNQLEEIIASTDQLAQPFMEAMTSCHKNLRNIASPCALLREIATMISSGARRRQSLTPGKILGLVYMCKERATRASRRRHNIATKHSAPRSGNPRAIAPFQLWESKTYSVDQVSPGRLNMSHDGPKVFGIDYRVVLRDIVTTLSESAGSPVNGQLRNDNCSGHSELSMGMFELHQRFQPD